MRILIVEDEYSIARDIEFHCRKILENLLTSLKILQTLEDAADYLGKNTIDLLLLDLNLGGRSGFDLLKPALSGPFHTIIISAQYRSGCDRIRIWSSRFCPKTF